MLNEKIVLVPKELKVKFKRRHEDKEFLNIRELDTGEVRKVLAENTGHKLVYEGRTIIFR